MPLAKQNLTLSFSEGVDTKSDPYQVKAGKLLVLENGILTSTLSMSKRFGFQGLNIGATQNSFVSTFQKELIQGDGFEMRSLLALNDTGTVKGIITNIQLTLNSVVRNTFIQTTQDCAFHSSGIEVYTWEDSRGSSRYSVVDSITRELIVNDASLGANVAEPKPMAIGQYILVIYRNSSNHHLQYVPISVLNPTVLGTATDLATDLNTAHGNFDAVFYKFKLYLAYNNTTGAGNVAVMSIDSLLNLSSIVVVSSNNASVAIDIFGTHSTGRDTLWVDFYDGTSVFAVVINSNFTVLAATRIIETIANIVRVTGFDNNGAALLLYESSGAHSYAHFIRANLCDTGGIGTPFLFLGNAALGGKPIFNGKDPSTFFDFLLPVIFNSVEQPTYFLVDGSARTLAKWIPNNGGGLPAKYCLPESALGASSTQYYIASLQKDLLTTISGVVYTQTGVSSIILELSPIQAPQKAELGFNTHIGGGILFAYDGGRVVEHGFSIFPENVTSATSTSGGLLSDGTYQYQVTYEWMDNQGQIHRSAPSPVVTQVTSGGGTSSNTLNIPTLTLTNKVTPIRIVVYRDQVNSAQPAVFYQVTSTTSPLLNDLTVPSVTFVDTLADSAIIGNPVLYTNGGVLPNDPAPATNTMTIFSDRIVYIPQEDPQSFGFSKQLISGSPVEFSNFQIQHLDQRGGNTVALCPMDNNLIFLKQFNLMYMQGQGPDQTGANNDFSSPQIIAVDGGCISNNSVVLTPQGVMYQSEKGFYLLGRNLQTQYIGADVEAYNKALCLSATLVPNTTQIRFIMDSGIALVWDYFYQQWSVFTNHMGNDACVWQGQYTYGRDTTDPGNIYVENTGYTDNGAFIKLRVVTSWLSLAQLQGFQRIHRCLVLGHYFSPSQLLFQVAYDFNPTPVQQDYIDNTSLLGTTAYGIDSPYGSGSPYGGNYPLLEYRIDMARQKCTSIQFSLEDVQGSNFGEGISISGISVMAGAKVGSNKLPASRSFG